MRTGSHRAVEVVFRQCVKGAAIGRLAPESCSLVVSSNFWMFRGSARGMRLQRPSSTPCHSAIRRATSFRSVLISLLLNQLEITKDIKPEPRFRPSPFCVNPHETCAFCTCPQKKRVFPCIFAVSPLRSLSAFAIVPNGPSLRRKTRGSFARR